MSILSIDSMAVYKGLDILTAKPTDVMQAQVKYYGLDIAEPDQNFSIIDYLNYLIEVVTVIYYLFFVVIYFHY